MNAKSHDSVVVKMDHIRNEIGPTRKVDYCSKGWALDRATILASLAPGNIPNKKKE